MNFAQGPRILGLTPRGTSFCKKNVGDFGLLKAKWPGEMAKKIPRDPPKYRRSLPLSSLWLCGQLLLHIAPYEP
jgi:hypothetical protein